MTGIGRINSAGAGAGAGPSFFEGPRDDDPAVLHEPEDKAIVNGYAAGFLIELGLSDILFKLLEVYIVGKTVLTAYLGGRAVQRREDVIRVFKEAVREARELLKRDGIRGIRAAIARLTKGSAEILKIVGKFAPKSAGQADSLPPAKGVPFLSELGIRADEVWGDAGGRGAGPDAVHDLNGGAKFIKDAIIWARETIKPPPQTLNLIEIGASSGSLSGYLADELGAEVAAVDVRPRPDGFNGPVRNVTYWQESATYLPFETGSAQGVVSSFGLEFAGEQAVSEAGRVLQSGGVFTGVTLKPGSVALARVVVSGRIAKRILKIQIEDDAGKKFRVYSELAGEINSAGWSFPGSAFERFFARLAFKDYAEKAFFGNLTDRDIASLRVQAVAGDRLEWFAQLDEDGIREVFRKNGFESVELREVTFKRGFNLDPVRDVVRVVNFDPTRQTAFSGEHKALGIIARKRNEPAEGATRVIVINDGYVAAWLRGNVKGYGSLHRNTQRRLIEGIKAEILEHPDMVSDFVTARVFSDAFNRAKAKMGMRPSELPLAGEDLGRVRGAKNGKGAKLDRFRSFKRTIGR